MASAAQEISFSDRSSDGFKPVDVGKTFGQSVDAEIRNWLSSALQNLIDAHADLHLSKIPKMRKLYLGKPESASKSFPFPGASNIVIQLIGDRADTLDARILGFIFATSPLWKFMYPAVSDNAEENDLKRSTLEQFMDIMGYEPSELDLYRIYGQWCHDHTTLGTGFVKAYIEDSMESVAVGYTEQSSKKFRDEQIYFGPRVEKLAHEDVLMYSDAQTIEKSRLVAQRRRLTKYDLQERVFNGFYDKDAVEKIIERPDRPGPDLNSSKEQRSKGVQPIQSRVTAEWDVYECYFPWIHNGRKFRLIYSFHLSTKTCLRRIFNFIPGNQTPIVRAKLGYRNDGAYGFGLAELLEPYQDEVSTTHRNRIDNSTLANTRFFRVGPSAINLGSQVDIFPSGAITANKDDFEAYQIADVYQSSFQNEEMTLQLADQRAGVAPAVAGMGSGGMMGRSKQSFYSAGPALATMQEQNNRTNLATSDFRHAHQKLGSLLTSMYAKFGIGERADMFGKNAKYLQKALDEFLKNRCRIPIQRHYTAQAQLMQAINNPGIPDNVKQYLIRVMEGSDRIMTRILKDFGYDQPEEFIPKATEAVKPQGGTSAPQGQGVNPAQLAAATAAATTKRPVEALPFQSAGGAGTPPVGGMETPPAGL
jgi:hypothetical protein